MKALVIGCADTRKWYANKVGQVIDILEDLGNEYKVRQDPDPTMSNHRFINFIPKDDAFLINESNDND